MSIKVAVNGRFEGRRLTGVDRYASEILRCLDGNVRVIKPRSTLRGVAGHLWEQLILPASLARGELLWSPANTGPVAVSDQVVTIHDTSVLEHPEWFAASFRLWYRLLYPWLAKRARSVLTVSEHSRRSIIRVLKVPEDKVISIPNGVNLTRFQPCDSGYAREKYGLPERYVLFVGSLDPRKNLARLLLAWEQLADHPDVTLVIAGSRTGIFRPVAIPPRSERVRYIGYVADEDLADLYAGALLFIMPSLFEGFGLTILEAMACGLPVITSAVGALPEVAGDAALLVDPYSVESLVSALRKLLSEEKQRALLRQRGLDRARRFSWERSAENIWKVLASYA